jgi:hypothetical protein
MKTRFGVPGSQPQKETAYRSFFGHKTGSVIETKSFPCVPQFKGGHTSFQ